MAGKRLVCNQGGMVSWQELWYCRIRFIHKDGMLVDVKAFYEKKRCMMVDRQVVAVEVLECSDERVSGEEMRSSDYKLTNGVFLTIDAS